MTKLNKSVDSNGEINLDLIFRFLLDNLLLALYRKEKMTMTKIDKKIEVI